MKKFLISYKETCMAAEHTTYVAEQNLDLEENPKAIQHPLINSLFTKFDGSQYHLKNRPN